MHFCWRMTSKHHVTKLLFRTGRWIKTEGLCQQSRRSSSSSWPRSSLSWQEASTGPESIRVNKIIQNVINPLAVILILGKVIEWMLVEPLLDEAGSLVDKGNIFDVADFFLWGIWLSAAWHLDWLSSMIINLALMNLGLIKWQVSTAIINKKLLSEGVSHDTLQRSVLWLLLLDDSISVLEKILT